MSIEIGWFSQSVSKNAGNTQLQRTISGRVNSKPSDQRLNFRATLGDQTASIFIPLQRDFAYNA